jgi:hypothetical protein
METIMTDTQRVLPETETRSNTGLWVLVVAAILAVGVAGYMLYDRLDTVKEVLTDFKDQVAQNQEKVDQTLNGYWENTLDKDGKQLYNCKTDAEGKDVLVDPADPKKGCVIDKDKPQQHFKAGLVFSVEYDHNQIFGKDEVKKNKKGQTLYYCQTDAEGKDVLVDPADPKKGCKPDLSAPQTYHVQGQFEKIDERLTGIDGDDGKLNKLGERLDAIDGDDGKLNKLAEGVRDMESRLASQAEEAQKRAQQAAAAAVRARELANTADSRAVIAHQRISDMGVVVSTKGQELDHVIEFLKAKYDGEDPTVEPASADPTPASADPTPASADPTPASADPTPASADPTPAHADPTPAHADPTPAHADGDIEITE